MVKVNLLKKLFFYNLKLMIIERSFTNLSFKYTKTVF